MTDNWPRGMREATAAEYLGLSVSSLRTVVRLAGSSRCS
jgi:hypothetical protein